MINLLGEKGFEGQAIYQGLEDAMQTAGVHTHIYGKETTKPFRKMGHVTIVNPILDEAKSTGRKIKELIKVVGAIKIN